MKLIAFLVYLFVSKYKLKLFICGLISITFMMSGCDTADSVRQRDQDEQSGWLIPVKEVIAAQGQDGIPSIQNPVFRPAKEINYVRDDRLVLGIKIGDTVRAYPHQVLDWHEIVNDSIGDFNFAVTYCPLTGTGIGWGSVTLSGVTDYGISGLLFRNNLIAYDRQTSSYWQQMQMRSIYGILAGESVDEVLTLIETTWKTWKQMYPNSQVLTRDTGSERPYESFAYGSDYHTDNDLLLFPVQNHDERLEAKKRVLGVFISQVFDSGNALTRVYPIDEFGDGINLIEETIQEKQLLIVGSSDLNFAVAFQAFPEEDFQQNFSSVQDELPIILKDSRGNRWDLFGYAVDGPDKGERLETIDSYIGYWFAWADMFPNVEVYKGN